MTTPTAIVAEDEPLIRREIRDTLRELWPELTVVAEAGDGVEALSAVERCRPSKTDSRRCPIPKGWTPHSKRHRVCQSGNAGYHSNEWERPR